jgi:hypothetical protein
VIEGQGRQHTHNISAPLETPELCETSLTSVYFQLKHVENRPSSLGVVALITGTGCLPSDQHS